MAAEYARRTAVTRLSVTDEQRSRLRETITEWTRGCQLATDLAWGTCHGKADVQQLAYDAVRDETDLGSQHAVLATHQAAQAMTGCRERRANGKRASKPTFTAPSVPYDARTMTIFDDDSVSLATVGDRVRCPLALPRADDGYQRQYLDDDDWSVTQSTLTARDGELYLHLRFRRPASAIEQPTAEGGTVLGVDLGIDNLAVTSTAYFRSGREFVHRLQRFQTVRAALQETGTRSARRTLVRVGGRERRYIRDVLHRTSNAVVDEARRYQCDVIAFEDLTDVRERLNPSWGHVWPFDTLYEQVRYKATGRGVAVTQVAPAGTSTRCADCGYTASANRPSRVTFRCQECGSEANADYNAAKNIGMRYVRRRHQSPRRTGNSQLALKSGTVTPNGGFTAYPDGVEAEFTDKSRSPHARSTDRAR